MPSKIEWLDAIEHSHGNPTVTCPLCTLAKRYQNPVPSCERCIFTQRLSLKHLPFLERLCFHLLRRDFNIDSLEFTDHVMEYVEKHKRQFLIPFVESLPEDHKFFSEVKNATP